MPLPVIAAGGWLASFLTVGFIVSWITKIIAALGFTVVAYVGMEAGLDHLESLIDAQLNGLAFGLKQMLDLAGVTTVIHWLIEAVAFSMLIRAAKTTFMRSSKV